MTDPIRLRDPRSSATKELRELLAAGRSETPDFQRLRGVASRLGFLPSPGGLLAKTGASGLGLGGATKIGALLLVLGGGVGVLAMRDRPVASAGAQVPRGTSSAEVALVQTSQPVIPPPTFDEPAVPAPILQPTRKESPRAAASGPAIAASRPAAVGSVPAQGESPAVAPLGLRAPSTWGSSEPTATLQAPVDVGPSIEAGPVQEAQRELASNPSRALYLAERDERTSGGLVEEREVVIIEALVRLGRLEEARPRAARFLRIFPASSHRGEVAAPFGFDPGSQNP